MYKKHNFLLMAAIGAALSVGGAAIAAAAPAPEFPDDGKIRIRNVGTGQVCEFDTPEAADNFGRNVEDRGAWELVKPTAAAPVPEPEADHPTLTDVIEPAAAPIASPVANETAAPGPATGETAPAGE